LAFNGHAYVYGAPINDFAHREQMLKNLRAIPGVTDAYPQLDSPGLAQSANGQTGLAYMRGIEPSALKAKKIIIDNIQAGGSAKEFGVGDYGGNTVLVGEGLAQSLGLLPGDDLTLMSPGGSTAFGAVPKRKVYTVGGIFKSGVSEIDKAFIYMPLQQAQLFFDEEDEWGVVEIKVADAYNIASYRDSIIKAAGEGALIEDWTEHNASVWSALKIERTAMRFILFFLVIIATMNIISGVVMLVKNKTRDVAILRTMGADRASISRVFFLCGSLIGVAGTLAGLLLGVLFCTFIREIQAFLEFVFHTKIFDPAVYYLSYVPAKMELGEVTFVVVGSLLASCLTTIFPALWASKLEPVEALRYE
jgi:lipoprotein-releasing system permease protein